jgi:hypothetical protein
LRVIKKKKIRPRLRWQTSRSEGFTRREDGSSRNRPRVVYHRIYLETPNLKSHQGVARRVQVLDFERVPEASPWRQACDARYKAYFFFTLVTGP